MSFPRYPKYKNSGAEWLGDVPEHWSVVQLKQLVEIQNGTDHKHVEQAEGYPVLGSGGVFSYASEFLFDGESVLFGRKGTIDKPLHVTGRFWTVDTMYWTKIRSNVCGRFVYYVALAIPFDYYSTNTALPSMTKGALNGHLIARPSLSEQTHIAALLDRETAKIDELTAEQRRLMELLKEKRQAAISRAVTKGLNPNSPMKPSGIEWLGDVPAHWEVRRLKNLLEEPLKYGANESAELEDQALPRFIRITDIDESGGLRDDTFKSLPVEIAEPYLLKHGDILLARSGATVGKSFLYAAQWGVACFAGYLIRVRLDQSICLAQWFNYFCQTSEYWSYVVGSQVQATIQNVNAEKYANLSLPLPPQAEQTEIILLLGKELSKLDCLVAEAQHAIDLLQERRTALISAAVTGKIDVRGLVEAEAT